MNDIIIIGSGIAGYSVATEIRKHNQDIKITMITASSGDYYYKPSISTALANDKEADSLVMFHADAMAARLNIDIIANEVVDGSELKSGIITTSKGPIPFEKCIIACGAETYKINVAGSGADDIIAVNNLDDYKIFRTQLTKTSKIAIIGAGLVGSEFAADLSSAGYDVTVFGDQKKPLDTLIPDELSQVFVDAMQQNGVKWVLGDLVNNVAKENSKYSISTTNGVGYEGFDIVFSAIGIKPNTNIAQQAGLDINKGICINNKCETSIDNIYAVGDCAEFNGEVLLYVAPIKKCAAALGQTLTGVPAEFSYPPMPIVVKTPPCPILSCLPASTADCRVDVSGEGKDLIIKYFDRNNNMKGFVLSGAAVKNRMACLAEMS